MLSLENDLQNQLHLIISQYSTQHLNIINEHNINAKRWTHGCAEVLSIIAVEFLTFVGQNRIKNQFVTTPVWSCVIHVLGTIVFDECVWSRESQHTMKTIVCELWIAYSRPATEVYFASFVSYRYLSADPPFRRLRSWFAVIVQCWWIAFYGTLSEYHVFDTHPVSVVKEAVGLVGLPGGDSASLLHNRWAEPVATPALSSG